MEKFAFVLMVILAANHKSDAYLMATCEADHECPSGYFCYLDTNYCWECRNCQVVHRHNSTRKRCTKDYSECGECLSGFQEEILSSGKPRPLCFPQDPVEEDNHQVWNVIVPVAAFLLIIMIMISIAVIYLIIHVRKTYLRGNRQITHCEEPPPYSSLAPVIENLDNLGVDHRLVIANERDSRTNEAASGSASGITEQSFSCAWAVSKEDNRLQEAVPFCQPTYVLENLNTSDHDSGVSELDNGSTEIEPGWNADLHDETTMPSEWTPNLINASENNCEMDLDEGACTESACEREGDVNSQVNQATDLMEQRSSQQMLPSMSPQSECN